MPDEWTLSTRTVRRWTARATADLLDETGEPGWKHVGFHDLRRTLATSLRSEDVDAMVVCDRGGWDDLETVLDHYRGTHPPKHSDANAKQSSGCDPAKQLHHTIYNVYA